MPGTDTRRLSIIGGFAFLVAGFTVITAGGGAARAANTGNTSANVTVGSSITLSGLTASFTLSGNTNTTATQTGAVTMNVLTNNLTGYNVTVQAAAANMTGSNGNSDTIAVTALKVKESSGLVYAPVSNALATPVHAQVTRSGLSGDTISNDYQIAIPFVSSDTYTVQLNYVASTT